MRFAYTSPDTLTNDVRLRGFLTDDASLFIQSPSGQPALRLRLEIWFGLSRTPEPRPHHRDSHGDIIDDRGYEPPDMHVVDLPPRSARAC